MRHIYILIVVLLHSCLSNAQNIEGIWQGELVIQGQKLPLEFELHQESAKWKGFMQSPAQSPAKIPITNIEMTGDSVMINVANIGLTYRGVKLGNEIKGRFQQGAFRSEMSLRKVEGASISNTFVRKQIVEPPYSYDTLDVRIKNSYDNDIDLAGTLSYPRKKGKYPAVLLLTGSGPQNRDEELFGHKPFKVLADYLTRNGIVVLRVDDRGVGQSSGNFENSTIENFSKDAIAAFEFLVKQKQVDKGKVGIIGHSEGGLIAELLAGQHLTDLSYIGLLAAPTFSIDQMMGEQLYAVGKAAGMSEKDLAQARLINAKNFAIVKSNLSAEEAYQALLENMKRAQMGGEQKQMERELLVMVSPAYRYFMRIEPEKYLTKIKIPVFAAFGTLDVQVPSDANLRSLNQYLPRNAKNVFKEYKGLNHLFQTAKTGQVSEYALIEETMDSQVMEDLAKWINSL